MSARIMLPMLVAVFVIAGSTAQGPQKYHCANMCIRNELPCPSPCPQCPKSPPCTTPVCPHPECPHIRNLPSCPEPVCGPLPKIPACPTPLVNLSCPHVVCPQHFCPPCPRCPDFLPCPVCPTAPPTTLPTTVTTTMATTTRATTASPTTTRATTASPTTTRATTASATTTRTTTASEIRSASTMATTPTTKPPRTITITSGRTTAVPTTTQSKTSRITELITIMGTTASVTRAPARTTQQPHSTPQFARTTVAEVKTSVTPEAESSAARVTDASVPPEGTSTALPPGYERTFGVGAFKLFPNKLTWHDANRTCGNDGAYLAIPRTAEQKEFLVRIGRHRSIDVIHVGFHLGPAGTFITALGEDMTTEERGLWSRGEPSGGPIYACVYLSRRGMSSQRCSDREFFVCQLS